ncbi:GNAT family N-acetyltransferase [Streptomyces sp. SL13]|uniref:GNAT family N-acetyltransferase n=1 Tax=Streptantibioticus silvisoli TaxID=2705255 RepID=A0AA90H0P6_9ACTN|nr:GNAT family N-acetyltransferase [Streptantibioticus silvisoli]MDI5962595.1 GNAT family N-acetyltransferase [Streptantibioticus silvisoli]MDI5969226.1 GNAT family N-acetyltransferase [Streptantibioticus silvisoli]
MSAEITIASTADDELAEDFARLLPQLSRSAKPLDAAALSRVMRHDANTVLVARVDGRVVGTLTLVVFPLPTGIRAWIEDVVVDDAARGHGVGAALTEAAIDLAHEAGAVSVDLTSRPSRVAANRLYQRVGFVARETTVYRHR